MCRPSLAILMLDPRRVASMATGSPPSTGRRKAVRCCRWPRRCETSPTRISVRRRRHRLDRLRWQRGGRPGPRSSPPTLETSAACTSRPVERPSAARRASIERASAEDPIRTTTPSPPPTAPIDGSGRLRRRPPLTPRARSVGRAEVINSYSRDGLQSVESDPTNSTTARSSNCDCDPLTSGGVVHVVIVSHPGP